MWVMLFLYSNGSVMADHDLSKLQEILTWVGTTNQLVTTRLNQLLADADLPLSQFILLNHFNQQPQQAYTVTQLTTAFQANQPAITKTIQSLVNKGYLSVEINPSDRRVRYHHLTTAGLEVCQVAIELLTPDLQLIFAEWTEQDVHALHQSLHRLKNWLNANRVLTRAND
jgi:DNA-binding MarR family transcriptional regulator